MSNNLPNKSNLSYKQLRLRITEMEQVETELTKAAVDAFANCAKLRQERNLALGIATVSFVLLIIGAIYV